MSYVPEKKKIRCKEAKRIAVAKIYKEESGEGRVQNVAQPLLILVVCIPLFGVWVEEAEDP